jgi:hypothetical protein
VTLYDLRRRSLRRFIITAGIGAWIILTALYAVVTIVRYDADPAASGVFAALVAASLLAGGSLVLLGLGFLAEGRPGRGDDSGTEADDIAENREEVS